jgi:hypothetical protein
LSSPVQRRHYDEHGNSQNHRRSPDWKTYHHEDDLLAEVDLFALLLEVLVFILPLLSGAALVVGRVSMVEFAQFQVGMLLLPALIFVCKPTMESSEWSQSIMKAQAFGAGVGCLACGLVVGFLYAVREYARYFGFVRHLSDDGTEQMCTCILFAFCVCT